MSCKHLKSVRREAQLTVGRGVQTKNAGSSAFSERQKLPRVHASKPECLMKALKSHSHSQAAVPRFPQFAFMSFLVQ